MPPPLTALRLTWTVFQQMVLNLTTQQQRVQSNLVEPMQRAIGSDFDLIWRGEDADAFRDKVRQLALPQAHSLMKVVAGTQDRLTRASDIIAQADSGAAQVAAALDEIASRI